MANHIEEPNQSSVESNRRTTVDETRTIFQTNMTKDSLHRLIVFRMDRRPVYVINGVDDSGNPTGIWLRQ